MEYQFTNEWFSPLAPIWEELFTWSAPSTALEVGSYEGRSACFMIEL